MAQSIKDLPSKCKDLLKCKVESNWGEKLLPTTGLQRYLNIHVFAPEYAHKPLSTYVYMSTLHIGCILHTSYI